MMMLEQMARAIAATLGADLDNTVSVRWVNNTPVPCAAWEPYLPVARAALEAIREPSEEWVWKSPFLLDDTETFTAMIDAILNEGRTTEREPAPVTIREQ